MPFLRYLLRRGGFALLLIVVVSSSALLLTLAAPGDVMIDDELNPDQAALQQRRAELGLDRPLATQYAAWLVRALRFDFGESILYRRPVNHLLGERAINTAVLASAALLIATVPGTFCNLFIELSAATPPGALPAFDLIDTIATKYGITTLGPPMFQ